MEISIHALVKRATKELLDIYGGNGISIHALVKRATLQGQLHRGKTLYFNPRPREEGDFNKADTRNKRMDNFNPRPREEGDYC